jgi:hypothetical protein
MDRGTASPNLLADRGSYFTNRLRRLDEIGASMSPAVAPSFCSSFALKANPANRQHHVNISAMRVETKADGVNLRP